MKFENAVRATVEIGACYEPGLRAVAGAYRTKLLASRTQCRWRGSVDIDAALAARCPNDPRWDYAVGFGYDRRPDGVAYVEVHPATSDHVDDVIRKKNWLTTWIARCAPALRSLTVGGFHWVSTDGVHIHPGSPQSRKLALCGITVGKVARIG